MKKQAILTLTATVVLVALGGWYLVKEADAAGPGDLLYPIDLASESIERAFTFDDTASAELEEDILDERVDELEALVNEDTVDEELVLEATENVSDQQSRTQTRLETEDGEQNGDLEQARERYETQVEEHLQIMEQVQEKVQGEDTQLKVQETVKNYQNSVDTTTDGNGTGNSSTNGNGNK
jgi:hypothetical protein